MDLTALTGGSNDNTLSLTGAKLSDLTIVDGNTVVLPTLENSNQLVTTDRIITVSGVGTKFGITTGGIGNSIISFEVAADPNNSITSLGNPSQGLTHTINAGWVFTTPFTVFTSGAAPATTAGRMARNLTFTIMVIG